ncbi:hypothetical protein [Maribacter sp. R77961]|uniref:hypothetical protein n=1 Tax=Maribacter sp. R77961 TaxID=3093871 RepID=UPI0037C81DFA
MERMKRVSSILAVLTLFFAGLCYYFLFYADAGPDGLGTFFSSIICGILSLGCFAVFFIQLWFVKEIRSVHKVIYIAIVLLPILMILWRVFYPQEYSIQEPYGIEVLE